MKTPRGKPVVSSTFAKRRRINQGSCRSVQQQPDDCSSEDQPGRVHPKAEQYNGAHDGKQDCFQIDDCRTGEFIRHYQHQCECGRVHSVEKRSCDSRLPNTRNQRTTHSDKEECRQKYSQSREECALSST